MTKNNKSTKSAIEIDAEDLDHEADLNLRIYVKTRNGWFFWNAFSEYRKSRRPLPDAVMAKLDQFASRLLKAQGQKEITQALEMTEGSGGPQGAARAKHIRQEVNMAIRVRDVVGDDVDHTLYKSTVSRVAKQFRKEPSEVKAAYKKWILRKSTRGIEIKITSKPSKVHRLK